MTKRDHGSLPPPPVDGGDITPAAEALWRLVARCEKVAGARGSEPELSAHLSYVTGRVCEELLEAPGRAEQCYLDAFGRAPSLAPNLRAARRLKARAGDWRAVIDLIEAELRSSERSPEEQAELHLERGAILDQELKDSDGAREAYTSALELDEANLQIWLRLASSLSRAKSWVALDGLLERVLNEAESPLLRAALLARRAALSAERLDDLDQARELYEAALELQPDLPAAFVGLERLYVEQQRWAELSELYERELKLVDGVAKVFCYYRLARLNTRRFGRADLAIGYLEKAVQFESDDVLVLIELGRLYEQAARFEDQVRIDERLLELSQDQTEKLALHHRIGLICEEQLDDDDRAIAHYRAAVELRPSYAPAIQALGRLYRKREMLEELLEMHLLEAKQASKVERQALAHYRAGEMLEHELGRVDEAVSQYEEALRWEPTFQPAQRALCRLYRELERWQDLIRLYENEAEHLHGGSVMGERHEPLRMARLEQAARLWEDKVGDLDHAAEIYTRILELDPGHISALYALEQLYEKAERWGALMELLEREVELVEDEGWAAALLHRIGELAETEQNDRTLAMVYYRRALTIRPSYIPTLTALGRIYVEEERFSDLLSMYRKEAEVAELPQARAAILFRIGELRENRLEDVAGAEDAYRQALELDPELWPALRAIERLLSRRRRWVELAEVLEGQAAQLEAPNRRAVAFYRVAELWEDRLGKTENAWDAYNQALAANPAFYPARVAMARLSRRRSHWSQLAEILGDQFGLVGDGFAGLKVLHELGSLWRHDLDAPAQACEAFSEMTAMVPNELTALLSLAELHWSQACWTEMADVARRMADVCDDPVLRVGALREIAHFLELEGEPGEAKEVWAEVLSLRPQDVAARQKLGVDVSASEVEVQRPEVAAVAAMLRVLAVSGDFETVPKAIDALVGVYAAADDWTGLDDALGDLIELLEETIEMAPVRGAVSTARARFRAEHLDERGEAEEHLRKLLSVNADDLESRAELAALLGRDDSRRSEAIAEHQRVLQRDPCRVSSIQALRRLWSAEGRPELVHLSLGALTALESASDEERETYETGLRPLDQERSSPIDRATLVQHIVEVDPDRPPAEATALLQSLEAHLAQLYAPDLGAFGLTRDDRIPPPERHPLRQRGELLGWLFDVPAFDVYLHQVPGRGEGLEMIEPPALVLPHQAVEWAVAHQVFVIGMLMGEMTLGAWVARKVTAFELHRLMTGAARLVTEDFERDGRKTDSIDNLRRKLERTLPQAVLDQLEPAAAAYAKREGDPIDFDRWIAHLTRVGRRAGLLACGDLSAALAVLRLDSKRVRELSRETSGDNGGDGCPEEVADLVGWYLSEHHLALRVAAGLDRAG